MPFNGFLGPLSEQSAPTRILRRRYSFMNDYTTLLRDSQVLCVYFLYLYIKANVGFRRANRGCLFNVCAPYPPIARSVSEDRKPVFFKLTE